MDGSLYWNSEKLCIYVQIGAGISAVLTDEVSQLLKTIN